MKLSIYGDSDVGRQRDHNEDSFIILADEENLWSEINNKTLDVSTTRGVIGVVADGMGGTNAGEVASEIAIKTVEEEIQKSVSLPETVDEIKKLMISMLLTGHKRIVKAARRSKETEGMGTTLIIVWIFNQSVFVVWSGDSRCYLYSPGEEKELRPFTDDHSLVWERVKIGEITPEEARLSEDSNLILQSLGGSYQKPEPDFKWGKIQKHDRILVCSDGLNSMLSDVGIQQILDFEKNSFRTCCSLIESANNAGGHDNITAVVMDVLEDDQAGMVPASSPERKRTKISWRYLVLPLAVLLILVGFLYRNEIGSAFHSNPTEGRQGDPETAGATEEIYIPENHVPEVSLAESTRTNTSAGGTVSGTIDSSRIEDVLNRAAGELLLVKKHLLVAEQGENVSFIKENRFVLDSIYKQFSLLESKFNSVASYTINTTQVEIDGIKVNDYPKASGIYLELSKECSKLKMRTESLIVKGE